MKTSRQTDGRADVPAWASATTTSTRLQPTATKASRWP